MAVDSIIRPMLALMAENDGVLVTLDGPTRDLSPSDQPCQLTPGLLPARPGLARARAPLASLWRVNPDEADFLPSKKEAVAVDKARMAADRLARHRPA